MDVRFQVGTSRFNFRSAGILIEKGHVLIHKQVGDSHWALPGGGIEMGEHSKDSVVREMKEELGYEVEVKHVPWVVENFFIYKGDEMHEVGFYYLLETTTSHYQSEPFHGLEGDRLIYQWLPIADLEEIDLLPPFLPRGLKRIPEQTEHLILNDELKI